MIPSCRGRYWWMDYGNDARERKGWKRNKKSHCYQRIDVYQIFLHSPNNWLIYCQISVIYKGLWRGLWICRCFKLTVKSLSIIPLWARYCSLNDMCRYCFPTRQPWIKDFLLWLTIFPVWLYVMWYITALFVVITSLCLWLGPAPHLLINALTWTFFPSLAFLNTDRVFWKRE